MNTASHVVYCRTVATGLKFTQLENMIILTGLASD